MPPAPSEPSTRKRPIDAPRAGGASPRSSGSVGERSGPTGAVYFPRWRAGSTPVVDLLVPVLGLEGHLDRSPRRRGVRARFDVVLGVQVLGLELRHVAVVGRRAAGLLQLQMVERRLGEVRVRDLQLGQLLVE